MGVGVMFLRFGDVLEVFPMQWAAVAAAGGVAVRRDVNESARKGYGGEFGCGDRSEEAMVVSWCFVCVSVVFGGFRWFSEVSRVDVCVSEVGTATSSERDCRHDFS